VSLLPNKSHRRTLPTVVAATLLGAAALGVSALTPAGAQEARAIGSIVYNVVNCRSTSACGGGVNSGTGFGVLAVSASSNGLDSSTKNASASRHVGRSGVYGHDDSTDGGGLNVGVAGSSFDGLGMQGSSTNNVGIQATSANYIGLQASGASWGIFSSSKGPLGVGVGSSGTMFGVQGFSDTGSGVNGVSTSSVGVYGQSTNGVGVFGSAPNVGVQAASSNVAVEADATGTGAAVIARVAVGDTSSPLYLRSGTTDPNNYAIEVQDGNNNDIFHFDNGGNIHITGLLYSQGSCSQGCSRTRRVASYAPRESMPSMEDVGEGRLVAGEARVRLDPAFANVIDRHASYVVFVSPEGESRGLYVTEKTLTGFTVIENAGGRSTIPFGYRIVAKPYGVSAERLPVVVSSPSTRTSAPMSRVASLRIPR
jgi:hypothetical protein